MLARWQLGDGSRLRIAVNLGRDAVTLEPAGEAAQLLFASTGEAAGERLPPHSTLVHLEGAQ